MLVPHPRIACAVRILWQGMRPPGTWHCKAPQEGHGHATTKHDTPLAEWHVKHQGGGCDMIAAVRDPVTADRSGQEIHCAAVSKLHQTTATCPQGAPGH